MGLPRSTYYDVPSVPADDTEIVLRIQAVCDEFRNLWLPPGRGGASTPGDRG